MLNGWRKHPEKPVWIHPLLGKVEETLEPKPGTNAVQVWYNWHDRTGVWRYRFKSLNEAKLTARRVTRPTQNPEFA